MEEARVAAIGGFAQALGSLAEEGSDVAKLLFGIEKAAAIADIIIKTQREIAGYYATYSLLPGGVAIASGFAAAAKTRAAIGIGTIAAQAIQGFAEGGKIEPSGVVTSTWGTPVRRSNGDNVLVRAGAGHVTLKTGEIVLNKRQQREAEGMYPGIWGAIKVPGFTPMPRFTLRPRETYVQGLANGGTIGMITPRPSPATVVQNQVVTNLGAFAERPVITDIREVIDVNARVTQINELSSLS